MTSTKMNYFFVSATFIAILYSPKVGASVAVPPQPIDIKIIADTENTIAGSWSSGGGTTSGYVVGYAQGTSAIACNKAPAIGSQTSASVKNLVPGTQYTFTLCAVNSAGAFSTPYVATIATQVLSYSSVSGWGTSTNGLNSMNQANVIGGANLYSVNSADQVSVIGRTSNGAAFKLLSSWGVSAGALDFAYGAFATSGSHFYSYSVIGAQTQSLLLEGTTVDGSSFSDLSAWSAQDGLGNLYHGAFTVAGSNLYTVNYYGQIGKTSSSAELMKLLLQAVAKVQISARLLLN
jgi:hypothetical protein